MVDYSKWNHIEVSDDEDETHPNIDTPSLFRWRHQARVDRTEEMKRERQHTEHFKTEAQKKVEETRKRLAELKTKGDNDKVNDVEKELKKFEDDEKKWRTKEEELAKKEKSTPWNVDTLSEDGFQKTVINKYDAKPETEMTEDEIENKHKKFVAKNEKLVKTFGMYKKFEDSQQFLVENPSLVCEDTSNYLVIWCVNLACEEKMALMEQVAHQCIVMQYLLELAKSLKQDPRACVRPFFSKISQADPEYMRAFDEEFEAFKARVRKRAKERYEKALKEAEEEIEKERVARIGPGGLDPAEVFESLPKELQECFESQDIPKLQATISAMETKDAEYHMKRCVDSGLWVADAKAAEAEKLAKEGGAVEGEEKTEEEADEEEEDEEESPYEILPGEEDGTSVD